MEKITRLLEVKLHVLAETYVENLTFTNGIVFVCSVDVSIEMFSHKFKTDVNRVKRDELETHMNNETCQLLKKNNLIRNTNKMCGL